MLDLDRIREAVDAVRICYGEPTSMVLNADDLLELEQEHGKLVSLWGIRIDETAHTPRGYAILRNAIGHVVTPAP